MLAMVTLLYGISELLPAIRFASEHHLPGIAATPENARTIKSFAIPPLYIIMAVLVLRKTYRKLAIIGAVFSLLYIPLGTIVGLIFLFWTRKEWPADVATPSSTSSASP